MLVVVCLGAMAMTTAWSKAKAVLPAGEAAGPARIVGFYEEEQTNFVEGPFGLEFFEDGTVHVFMGGKKIGPPARCTVEGRKIRVQHACGVWDIVPKGEKFYHTEYGSYLKKKV